ncbi:3-mercaptopyruvate sulfurtransferase [Phaeospirillum tilakii]|uniref:Sulfurtransferase n=1 Tax=Phaeospirillum tilakii TaxID=741673 RepID=A0ABW5CAW0_9PROT
MSLSVPDPLVTAAWLADHLAAPDVRVVDATWFLPTLGRDARAEYRAGHIPGAVFFDIDEIADRSVDLPHMLPPSERFAAQVGALGLGNGHQIVVYDGNDFAASARVWWMFRAFGHDDVVVLDGGLGQWRREGRPVEDLPPPPRNRVFVPRVNRVLVRDFDHVLANVASGHEQLVDVRPAARFRGEAPEPRPCPIAGHVPGALNLPASEVLDPVHRTLLPAETLRERVAAAGIDLARPIVVSCGSGVTACIVALALFRLGVTAAIYDGSWAEWSQRPGAPVTR